MAKPKSKIELLEQCKQNYKLLCELVNDLGFEKLNSDFPAGTLNRNVRDVLAHLHEWHLMFFNWYDVGMKGEKPEMPAKGYTWKTTPDLNKVIWKKYNNVDLKKVRELFNKSHTKIQSTIEKHSDEELFTKKYYNWTGSTSLGSYLTSATSSHYNWAFKLIKKSTK